MRTSCLEWVAGVVSTARARVACGGRGEQRQAGPWRRHAHTGIEDLKEKREEVNRQILKDEEEKQKIQNDLRILTERLSRINDSLARKVASRNEYDKTIMETEAAYMKILESSQTLLHVLKRESVSLTKKKQASN